MIEYLGAYILANKSTFVESTSPREKDEIH